MEIFLWNMHTGPQWPFERILFSLFSITQIFQNLPPPPVQERMLKCLASAITVHVSQEMCILYAVGLNPLMINNKI